MTSGAAEDRPISVIVVEDEPDVRQLLAIQLRLYGGFEVLDTAKDGEEALARCSALHPDAVVMDLLLPKVNGFEAISALKENLPTTAIVAYTGVAGDYVRAEMGRSEVPVILKSGDPTLLAEALRAEVARIRSESRAAE